MGVERGAGRPRLGARRGRAPRRDPGDPPVERRDERARDHARGCRARARAARASSPAATPEENARAADARCSTGSGSRAENDIVALNAGALLMTAGQGRRPCAKASRMAREALAVGRGRRGARRFRRGEQWLSVGLLGAIVARKRREVAARLGGVARRLRAGRADHAQPRARRSPGPARASSWRSSAPRRRGASAARRRSPRRSRAPMRRSPTRSACSPTAPYFGGSLDDLAAVAARVRRPDPRQGFHRRPAPGQRGAARRRRRGAGDAVGARRRRRARR